MHRHSKIKRASMNHTYRLVWSDAKQMFIAVAEITPGKGKRNGGIVGAVAALMMGFGGIAHALDPGTLPTGANVTHGNATITQNNNVMNINQHTDKLITNWQTFNIGADATVNFHQPSASSAALNRILDQNPSQILGNLNANGQVYLINPNGILFGQNSQVDVGGLIASTLEISDQDFLNNRLNFQNLGLSHGQIQTLGTIRANGGVVALIANKVSNQGTIEANNGNVALAAGNQVTLDFSGDGLMTVTVEQGVIDALAQNGGLIQADGGFVIMTTQAQNDIYKNVVNNSGIIQAQTLANKEGKIMLMGGMTQGTTIAGGTLDASAPNGGNGGFIETSAAHVYIDDNIQVTTASVDGATGEWLIDPYDIVVASSGGHITGATLATALNSTNVTLDTTNPSASGATYAQTPAEGSGDITINDVITKTGSSATTLTLKAHNDINVNQEIKSTSGRLNIVLTADQDNSGQGNVNFGANGKVTTNGGNFYVGSVSGTYDSVTATAQNFTMATGSYIDVGAGNIDIKVKGNITLADNSAQTNTYSLMKSRLISSDWRVYFNGNNNLYYPTSSLYHKISLTAGGSIVGGNSDNTKADIITAGRVILTANGAIGSGAAPIKIEGSERAGTSHSLTSDLYYPFPDYAQSLSVTNTLGASYIAEINKQIFGTISLTVGGSTSGLQSINIMDDAVGNGTGHILATAAGGTLSVATNGINTKGVKRTNDDPNNYYDDYDYNETSRAVYPTSVSLSAPTIELADNAIVSNSVNYRRVSGSSVWSYTYTPTLSLSGTNILASGGSNINGTSETSGFGTVTLSAPNIGSTTNALEISTGSLSVNNTGGNTYLANAQYGTLNFEGGNQAGVHHVLSSNGDFFNVKTGQDIDGDDTLDGMLVESISGTSNGSNWGASSGIHTATQFNVTGNNNQGSGTTRNVSLSARSGGIIFADNSVNVGGADFTASIPTNSSGDGRVIRSLNAYDAANQAAQITAGNVYLNNFVNDTATPISIGGGDYHLQIARGSGTALENSLNLTTTAGEVNIHELSENHFKTINTTLNNSNVAQAILIDLAGDDHIQYSDNGSRIYLDADKVKLDSFNRNWNFNATSRQVQLGALSSAGVHANTLGTGSYTVNASRLYLDSDVLTDGGALRLTGQIDLLRDVRIDTNADDLQNTGSEGSSGSIYLSGQISGESADRKLVIDSSSSTTSGGSIQIYSTLGNAAGHYLTDFRMTAKGSTDSNDGSVYFYGTSYLLDGNFHVTGNTFLNSSGTFDTEQGNTKDAGNITFDGYRLSTSSHYNYIFNTSTTAAGKNGGNIDLYNTVLKSQLLSSNFTLDARGGAGADSGSIYLPAINTTTNTNRSIDIKGGDIVLNGDLRTNWGNVSLAGNVLLGNTLTIDTWSSTSNQQTATAGTVSMSGTLAATNATSTLTIDTGTDTASSYFNATSLTPWAHSTGAVTINTAENNTAQKLAAVVVNAIKSGTHNTGNNNALITVSGVSTSGNQTYTGNLNSFGNLSSLATIRINAMKDATSISSTGTISAAGLLLDGSNSVFAFNDATGHKVDTLAVRGASSLTFQNGQHALEIEEVSGVRGINADGAIDISTRSGDLTINADITSASVAENAIILNAGKGHAAGTATGGNIVVNSDTTLSTGAGGRVVLYSGEYDSTSALNLLAASDNERRFNSDPSNTTPALDETGVYVVYRGNVPQTTQPDAQQAAANQQVDNAVKAFISETSQTTQGTSGAGDAAPSLGINANSGVTLLASLNSNGLVVDSRPQPAAVEPVAAGSPATIQMANVTMSMTASGSSAPITFTQAGNSVTMGTGAVTTEEVAAVGLPIFENKGSTLVLDSVVDVRDRGSSLISTPVEGAVSNLPSLNGMNIVQQTQIELTQADGSVASLGVSLTDDGLLILDLPDGDALSDQRQISLLGAAAAKQMGVGVDKLKGIVIQKK